MVTNATPTSAVSGRVPTPASAALKKTTVVQSSTYNEQERAKRLGTAGSVIELKNVDSIGGSEATKKVRVQDPSVQTSD